jgi:hypothetical protein
MSQPDLIAIALAIFIPSVLVARRLIQASRGAPFSQSDLVVVGGALVVGLVAALIYRSPFALAVLPPSFMVLFGVYLALSRGDRGMNPTIRIASILGIVVGATGLLVLAVRAIGGG